MKDRLFTQDLHKQFEFDEGVASVFDDMASRSIPYYNLSMRLSVDFAFNALLLELKTRREKMAVYDLGCSTGSFLIELAGRLEDFVDRNKIHIRLVGVDSSFAMIERAKLKTKTYGKKIEFICEDFLQICFCNSNVVIANYTLQFVRPLQRDAIVRKIFDGLEENGIFIMSEKMTSSDKVLDKQMIDRYHLYKKDQGYTQSEIASKREALENVLVPYSLEENFTMLKNAGFEIIEVLFKWVNFATIIARKGA